HRDGDRRPRASLAAAQPREGGVDEPEDAHHGANPDPGRVADHEAATDRDAEALEHPDDADRGDEHADDEAGGGGGGRGGSGGRERAGADRSPAEDAPTGV